MPDQITCAQHRCAHHVGFGTCGAQTIAVGTRGRGKRHTFCNTFNTVENINQITDTERLFGDMYSGIGEGMLKEEIALEIQPNREGPFILCSVMKCRHNEQGACHNEQELFFEPPKGQLEPICTGFRR